MRNISTASLAKLTQRKGTEPCNIVEIQWQKDGPTSLYADKGVEGMEGRVLVLDSFEDVINVSKSGTSQSVNITLDDSDGALKQIFNNADIHKKKVWIYQWFTGIPLSDKILLFLGVIASPVVWKEGDRTLSFSVISQSEDLEVGFSPEEGSFPTMPQGLIGTAWPLVFGKVSKIPGILMDNIVHDDDEKNKSGDGAASVTTEGTGIKDPSIDHRITDNENNSRNATLIAQIYFLGYLQASFTARKHGELGDLESIDKGKGYFSGLAKQYLQQGNAKLKEASAINTKNQTLKTVRTKQQDNQKKSLTVTNGDLFPQGVPTKLNLNGGVHEGYFLGNSFQITSRTHPAVEKYDSFDPGDPATRQGIPVLPREEFFWADAGIPIKLGYLPPDPDLAAEIQSQQTVSRPAIRYIVAATLPVSVSVVFAYRTGVDGIKKLAVVPFNYFTTVQTLFGTLPVTMVVMAGALSERLLANGKSEGWEDEIWVSCQCAIGPNTVDILKWLIETYTGRTWDATTFAAVRTLVDPYPMNFAVQDRRNVLSLISDIAYQARCIVWLKNDVFYIKYLAQAETPVDTITADDVIEQTMEVQYTETEDLVTKYVAHWRADYKSSKSFGVILRYNVAFYGVQEKEFSYFCFNQLQLVEKAATFHLIREANTFKKLRITVPISKLKIETLDTVTVDLGNPYLASGPIDCVVEEAKLNTENYTIDLTLWAPVRAGEMEKYLFAYMGDLQVGYYFPTDDDIQKGRAGSGRDVPYNNNVQLPAPGPAGSPDYTRPFSGDHGNGGIVKTTDRPVTWGNDPTTQTDLNQFAPEILQRYDASSIVGTGVKPAGTTKYQYDEQNVKNDFVPESIVPRTLPGSVRGKTGEGDGYAIYTVEVWTLGFGGKSTLVEGVVYVGPKDQVLSEGTGVMVSELFVPDDEGKTEIHYYMASGTSSGGGMIPAQIVSGTGDTYQVKLYRNGPDDTETPEQVQCFQLDIDEDETIPVDTWVFVTQMTITMNPGTEEEETVTQYYMQVPIWM
jgi:hypothetical protein